MRCRTRSGPTFQVIALNIAYMAGGVVVVETLFNYPGIGLALRDAVREVNLPVVQFLAMLIASSTSWRTCSPTSARSSSLHGCGRG